MSDSTVVECLHFSDDLQILVGEKGQGLICGLLFPRDSKSEEIIKKALSPDEIDFESHMNIGDTITKLVNAERREKLYTCASMFEIRPPLINKNRRGYGLWLRYLIGFLNHGSPRPPSPYAPWDESWKHDVVRALTELLTSVEADGDMDKMKKYSFHVLLKESSYGGAGRQRFTLFMFQMTTNKRGFKFQVPGRNASENAGLAFSFHTFSIPTSHYLLY